MYKVRKLLMGSTLICTVVGFQIADAAEANGESASGTREFAGPSSIILAQAAEPESKPGSAPQRSPTSAG